MRRTCFTLLLSVISITAVAADMSGMDMKGMDMPGMRMTDSSSQTYRTTGIVKRLDAAAKRVTIAHQPVEGLGWPAMTMTFTVEGKLLEKLRPGKEIRFGFVKRGNNYLITSVD